MCTEIISKLGKEAGVPAALPVRSGRQGPTRRAGGETRGKTGVYPSTLGDDVGHSRSSADIIAKISAGIREKKQPPVALFKDMH